MRSGKRLAGRSKTMRKTVAAGAAVIAATLLVSSIGVAATPKPPKRWRGTAVYTYTLKDDERTVQQTVTGSILLVPVRRAGWPNTYEVSSGTIKSEYKETASDGCTLTSSASYAANKYLLTLQLSLTRPPRASFSGSEGAATSPASATRTCPDGTSQQTELGGVASPFFMLTRHTAGFPVTASLTKIAGSLRTAQSGIVWTVRFSFIGQR
jgi:hypothetical protein